ncbi:MAG: heme exporter protein CcmD [Moraxella sp.]|nr:heme exporter protein CcmD [Moraxella sp.]
MTPYFESFADFISMGGHGVYVWLCWGLVLGAAVLGVCYAKHERKTLIKKIQQNALRKSTRPSKARQ